MKFHRSLLVALSLAAALHAADVPTTLPDLSFLPRTAAGVEIVGWDGFSYVDGQGRTFWSGVATPSAADLDDALTSRRPVPPPVAVPAQVSRRQLFLALLEQSPTLTRTAIRAQLTTEAQLVEFDEAQEFRRDHPLIAALAAALGFSAGEVDQVFIRASQL